MNQVFGLKPAVQNTKEEEQKLRRFSIFQVENGGWILSDAPNDIVVGKQAAFTNDQDLLDALTIELGGSE